MVSNRAFSFGDGTHLNHAEVPRQDPYLIYDSQSPGPVYGVRLVRVSAWLIVVPGVSVMGCARGGVGSRARLLKGESFVPGSGVCSTYENRGGCDVVLSPTGSPVTEGISVGPRALQERHFTPGHLLNGVCFAYVCQYVCVWRRERLTPDPGSVPNYECLSNGNI